MAKIVVVGIGPGNFDDMTPRARKAIENASVVAGYKTYINLIEPLLEGKEVIGTGMTQEIDRCKAAVEAAAAGKDTVVVSSGDSGVYGMAGLVLELVLQLPEAERPEWGGVVAGVSAVNAAASLLGAPLMHDFAVISLSDWMTPWELIKKRAATVPVGIVSSASREKESIVLSDLGHFTEENIGMFSMVIIGNSNTYVKDGYMITPRGYKITKE